MDMTVVLVDTTLAGPLIGGAQTFLPHLAAGLVERGATVHIVSAGAPDARISEQLRWSGALLHTQLWPRPALVEDSAPLFAHWLNQLNPDIYLISVSPDIGWAVLPYLPASIATLAIAHSDSNTFYRPLTHYSALLTRAVGVSQTICERLAAQCALTAEQAAWIPYGVVAGSEPERNYKADAAAPLRIAYVSRLREEQKRSSDVIRIVERLRAIEFNYELDVIGDGPLTNTFRTALAPELADGRVRLHGWLAPAQVLEQLRRAEVFLLTSEYEGFCIALTEAMANGLAPIVTDIPSGNQQLVRHEENGLLVAVGDIDEFVNNLQRLAAERRWLHNLRQAAWRTGQRFTLSRMVDAYLECFEQARQSARSAARRPAPDFPLMESCRSRYPLWLRRIKVAARRVTQTALF